MQHCLEDGKVIQGTQWRCLDHDEYLQVCSAFRQCKYDADRFQLIDWAAAVLGAATGEQAVTNLGLALFIDDSRYTVSSASAAVMFTAQHTEYATEAGVIFETTQDSKSTVAIHPGSETPDDMHQALRGTLLGGAPRLVDSGKFLGIQEIVDISPAVTTLKQRERNGAALSAAVCRKTDLLQWALPARKYA